MVVIALVAATLLGLAVGSFLNVVAARLPDGLSLSRPGSRCPRCGHGIRARDNVPVVSYLLLRGPFARLARLWGIGPAPENKPT